MQDITGNHCPLLPSQATRENDRERERFKAEISANEVARRDIQGRVQSIVDSNQSAAFLNLLSTFRLQVGGRGVTAGREGRGDGVQGA